MDFYGVLSCLSLLLAAAVSQGPKPCLSPPLMSGGFTLMSAERQEMHTGTISYDATGERMRLKAFGFVGNETFTTDQLVLLKENLYYETDWKTFSCEKRTLYGTFNPFEVPSDAKLLGHVVMGSSSSSDMGVVVNSWYGELPFNQTYSMVFTDTGCIPLTISSHTPYNGWVTLSTFNWVLGISNPSDFIPPSICNSATLRVKETPDTVFDAFISLARKARSVE